MNEQPQGKVGEPSGDEEGREGGKAAAGEVTGSRGQLDGASGGYGSQSGTASSGGSGEGEPVEDEPGTPGQATGASGETPTDWLRGG